jgi:hypothetical protein
MTTGDYRSGGPALDPFRGDSHVWGNLILGDRARRPLLRAAMTDPFARIKAAEVIEALGTTAEKYGFKPLAKPAKPYGIWIECTRSGGEPVGTWATIVFGGALARYATIVDAEAAVGRFRDLGHNATAKPFGEMAEDGDQGDEQ